MSFPFLYSIRKSYGWHFTLGIGVILFSALSIFFLFFIQRSTIILEEGLVHQGQSLVDALSAEIGFNADAAFVDVAVRGHLGEKDVVFLGIYDREGRPLVFKSNIPNAEGDLSSAFFEQIFQESKGPIRRQVEIDGKAYYEFFAPIEAHGEGRDHARESEIEKAVGFSRVGMSLDRITRERREILIWYLAMALGVLALGAFFAFHLTKKVSQGILDLLEGVRWIERGDYEHKIPVRSEAELNRAIRAFNRMLETLKEGHERELAVSRLKSEFLSITAHQLRTPLSALKWVLYMVLEGDTGPLKKAQKELLEKGYKSNERMIALVNDLLDVVRIEEGRFDYKFTEGSAATLIEDIVRETKIIADQRGVQLLFHKSSHRLPMIALDESKFRLALSNIIVNAVRYTNAKGRVDVELTLHDDEILVLVKDTGIGMSKAQVDRLFTKFFRAENAIRMQPTGSGLGLFIAKNIIEKHGGKIWIESEEGKGTTVYFTIPVKR
ncbi:MAG: HAMP domain-containing histidine kinase [Candidatus Wildermuthbacteria bacterium]|nr:HAMP domain-containing histidine kinase [Candidatus Wildermuthbacteria bacterium]